MLRRWERTGGASAATAQNLLANPEFDGFGTSGFPNDPFPDWNSIGDVPDAGDDADRVQHVVDVGKNGVLFSLRADSDAAYAAEFDRAYLGRAERVFADDLEIGSFCRWSFFVE